MQSKCSNLSPVSLVTVCLLLLVLATTCEAVDGSILIPAVAVPTMFIIMVVCPCVCVCILKLIGRKSRSIVTNNNNQRILIGPGQGSGAVRYIYYNWHEQGQLNSHQNTPTGEEQTLTAGGQPSSTDVNPTIFNSTHSHPTAPPSEVLTQQVDTQLPQAGLHEGEAPPRYEEAVKMEGYY